jgi:hypothetical protein
MSVFFTQTRYKIYNYLFIIHGLKFASFAPEVAYQQWIVKLKVHFISHNNQIKRIAMKKSSFIAGVLFAGMLGAGSASAIELRSGFGGPEGYGELTQLRNDDSSSNQINLPFAINFFSGNSTFSKFYVNNNGNISFNSPLATFTPNAFPVANQPIIAPFWADVDTRGAGAVYAAAPNADSLVVTWHNVGYYSSQTNKINDFQMTLLNRADTGAGNFDIEFRYNQLQWTTGSASGGTNGLGGIPAQAGYDAGNGRNFFVLPGSLTGNVLNLATTSNVSQSTPGLWTMAIRNGTTSDGSSAQAPLLPTIVDDAGFHFNFDIDLNQRIFIDPAVAVGYDYTVSNGPNIRTVLLPTVAGDTDGYSLYTLDDLFLANVAAGDVYDFGASGINGFRVRGIDMAAGLDPSNTQAFVTGLTFVTAGNVTMTQTPITGENQNDVPEPSSILLLGTGLMALVARKKSKNNR